MPETPHCLRGPYLSFNIDSSIKKKSITNVEVLAKAGVPSFEALLLKTKVTMGRTCAQDGRPSFAQDRFVW